MTTLDPMTRSRQCTATSKQTGERCRATAIPGGTVCRHHGGAAPQVRKKARERLLALADPAAAGLGAALANAVKSQNWPQVIQAAKAILDRAGHPAGIELKIEEEVGPRHEGWDSALSEDESRVAKGLFARALARRGNSKALEALEPDGEVAYLVALANVLKTEWARALPEAPPEIDVTPLEEVKLR